MKRFLRFVLKLFLWIILAGLIYYAVLYITCPVYRFAEPSPFRGDKLYNPYQNMNPSHWRKANFQVQSKAWGGITDGRKNTNEEIERVYKNLGYDIIATSDYQKINYYKSDQPSFIPVYEHGYNIRKVHQVLIGSGKVLWRDFPFFQNLHNKQRTLNLLRDENDIIVIAHPNFEKGYKPKDMKYLANYDAIEALNYFRRSFEHWDTALSSGNFVTIIGNDDVHDISNPDEVGQYMTFINAPDVNRANVTDAIRKGNSFGVYVYRQVGETMENKIIKAAKIPRLQNVRVSGDTLLVNVSDTASKILFIGQNGIQKSMLENTASAFCVFSRQDTYIRAEIHFPGEVVFYLNPVCRYEGNFPAKIPVPGIHLYKTWLLRILGFASLIFIVLNIVILRQRLRKK
ncbi:MAG: hypothetical protein JXA03_06845 [Bacteroidales bacterium]|nr:hypothetical protein [Bacteroidales bacterium]